MEEGVRDISIGEGSIVTAMSNTMTAFAYAGIDRLSKKYGVKLIDLNRGPFRKISIKGFDFELSDAVFDADFVINVAVLKNHFQTKVSLCMKNLKGCLSKKSKRECHKRDLERSIALYNTVIPVDLNLIDGIYALINGPWIDSGVPRRSDLIIASKDRLNCDIAGSLVLGVDPNDVAHMKEFSMLKSRSAPLCEVNIRGEKIEKIRVQDRYEQNDLFQEIFQRGGIKGICFPDPGKSICSGCFGNIMVALLIFCQDNQGILLDDAEIIAGKERKVTGNRNVTLLYGDCAIENNEDAQESKGIIKLGGCPPTFYRTYSTILKTLLNEKEADRQLFEMISLKTKEKEFSFFDHLEPPTFDIRHF